jgi:hypothetical protein
VEGVGAIRASPLSKARSKRSAIQMKSHWVSECNEGFPDSCVLPLSLLTVFSAVVSSYYSCPTHRLRGRVPPTFLRISPAAKAFIYKWTGIAMFCAASFSFAQSGPDLSKLPSQYFTMKQQHLWQTLNLSQDQQERIKPFLEQETFEAGQTLADSSLSHKDKLNRWEKMVRASDENIKPFLSQPQLDKLQELRKEQKQDLKKIVPE